MFGKISSWLPLRSAEDCVKFYYCSKKRLPLKGSSKPGVFGISSTVLESVPFASNSLSVPNRTSPKQAKSSESLQSSSSGKRGRKRKEEESETDLLSPDEDYSSSSTSNTSNFL